MKKLLSRGKFTWELPQPSLPQSLLKGLNDAFAYLKTGQLPEAIDLCSQLALEHPSSPEIMSLLSNLSDDASDLPMAVVAGTLAHQLYRTQIPPEFSLGSDTLPGYLDGNRPMLENIRHLADLYDETGARRVCRELCEWALKLDPADEYGLRTLLPKIYMEEKNTIGMARLAREYPEDYAPEILLGTLYMAIINNDSSQERLWSAVCSQFPLLAAEMLKTIHKAPKGYDPNIGYFADTAETAWSYWDFYGSLWMGNERTAAFLAAKRSQT